MRALDEVSHQGDVALDIVPVGKLNRGVHVAHRDPDGARQGPGASSLHRRSIGAAPHGHLVRDLVAARGVHQQVVERRVGNGEPVEPIDADAGSEAGVLDPGRGETSVRDQRGSKPPTGCTRMKPRSSIALTMKPISSRWAATITFSGGASPLVRDARRTAMRFPSRSTRTSSAWGSSSARAKSRTASSQPETPGASHRARSNCSLMVHVLPRTGRPARGSAETGRVEAGWRPRLWADALGHRPPARRKNVSREKPVGTYIPLDARFALGYGRHGTSYFVRWFEAHGIGWYWAPGSQDNEGVL